MRFKQMFVTAVCVLFLLKLKLPNTKNFYETIHERYGHDTLETVKDELINMTRAWGKEKI